MVAEPSRRGQEVSSVSQGPEASVPTGRERGQRHLISRYAKGPSNWAILRVNHRSSRALTWLVLGVPLGLSSVGQACNSSTRMLNRTKPPLVEHLTYLHMCH